MGNCRRMPWTLGSWLYCSIACLELLLAAIGGEPSFEADEAELGAGGEFAPDVDFAGGVVAD